MNAINQLLEDTNTKTTKPTKTIKKEVKPIKQIALYLPADLLVEAKQEAIKTGKRTNTILIEWINKGKQL
jgi:hypothetical protein